MKDFDNTLLTELQSEGAVSFWFVDLEISDSQTLYLSTFDIDLLWDGNTYQSTELGVNPVSYDGDLSVDKLKLDFANVGLTFSSYLLNNIVSNRPCTVYVAVLKEYTVYAEPVFSGLVSEWNLDEKKAIVTISSELVYWNKKTLRKASPLCPWEFKGTECGYSGVQTVCNKTYNECQSYGRTDYFGGFRFISALEEKEIWWGKAQK